MHGICGIIRVQAGSGCQAAAGRAGPARLAASRSPLSQSHRQARFGTKKYKSGPSVLLYVRTKMYVRVLVRTLYRATLDLPCRLSAGLSAGAVWSVLVAYLVRVI